CVLLCVLLVFVFMCVCLCVCVCVCVCVWSSMPLLLLPWPTSELPHWPNCFTFHSSLFYACFVFSTQNPRLIGRSFNKSQDSACCFFLQEVMLKLGSKKEWQILTFCLFFSSLSPSLP